MGKTGLPNIEPGHPHPALESDAFETFADSLTGVKQAGAFLPGDRGELHSSSRVEQDLKGTLERI